MLVYLQFANLLFFHRSKGEKEEKHKKENEKALLELLDGLAILTVGVIQGLGDPLGVMEESQAGLYVISKDELV